MFSSFHFALKFFVVLRNLLHMFMHTHIVLSLDVGVDIPLQNCFLPVVETVSIGPRVTRVGNRLQCDLVFVHTLIKL